MGLLSGYHMGDMGDRGDRGYMCVMGDMGDRGYMCVMYDMYVCMYVMNVCYECML